MKNKNGFLLFELMICCALLVLVSFCIVAPYTMFNKLLAKSEIQALCSFFNYTQQKAVALQKDISVFFDPTKQTYTVENTVYQLHKYIRFAVFSGVKGPPSSPNHYVTEPITYKNNMIIFYKNGTVSSGTLYLVDTYYSIQYAITNSVNTMPYLRLYQYETGKWLMM